MGYCRKRGCWCGEAQPLFASARIAANPRLAERFVLLRGPVSSGLHIAREDIHWKGLGQMLSATVVGARLPGAFVVVHREVDAERKHEKETAPNLKVLMEP